MTIRPTARARWRIGWPQKPMRTRPSDRPRLAVIHRRGKGGLGTAYVAGMQRALADGAEYVVQMDADFSHSPAYIPAMLGVMLATDAHVVIGSRYVPGGTLDEGWGLGRRLMSWWANFYSRAILGLRIRDMTAGFKLWRRSALLDIGLDNIRTNGYSFQVEMAYLCEMLGYRLIEIPIHFEDRRIGQSKLDIPVKLESGWRTWQIRWRYRHLRRAQRPPGQVSRVAGRPCDLLGGAAIRQVGRAHSVPSYEPSASSSHRPLGAADPVGLAPDLVCPGAVAAADRAHAAAL